MTVGAHNMNDREFSDLYRTLSAQIFRYAARRTSAENSEVVVSETFASVWRNRKSVPSKMEDIRPWIFRIARSEISRRQRDRLRMPDLIPSSRLGDIPVVEPDVSHRVLHSALSRAIWSSLSPRDREALELVVWDGLSIVEAATVVGCSVSAFSTRLSRARRLVDHHLNEFDRNERLPQPKSMGGWA